MRKFDLKTLQKAFILVMLVCMCLGGAAAKAGTWWNKEWTVRKQITIDTSPRHYHYLEFGQNLLGTHHGHGAKPEKLPLIMATDMPEAWGRTKHRYWLTGHLHHEIAKEYEGCRVETFGILPPADAWAHQKGYRARRQQKAIVYHREHGEVARHTVTPSMFSASA